MAAIAHKSETSTATKFEMARPIFPRKCFLLFLALCDLWPLPWHKDCILRCYHDNSIKKPWIGPEFLGSAIFHLGIGYVWKSVYMVRLTLSRWRPIKEKWRVPFFSKCRNFVNNSRNCTKFEVQGDHGCPFDFWYFDHGVTSHDLFVTFTVFQKLWRKWTLAQKLLVLE